MRGWGLALSRRGGALRPALDLNFLSGALDGRVTFTRASVGWFFNSAGVLTSAAINAPRFDYDPVTLVPRGLLIEEARTNLFLNSAVGVTQSVTVAAVANTLSFYGTGTVTLTGVSTAGPLVGTGATNRVSLTFTPTAGSLTLTVSGSVTNVQLEAGSFATSPIVTVGSSVARALDVASITTLTPWYNATAGTLFAEATSTLINTSSTAVALHDGSGSNLISLRFRSTAPILAASLTTGGVAQITTAGATYTAGAVAKLAVAYQTDDVVTYLNGVNGITDTLATIPTVTTLQIGSRNGGAEPLNGYIRRVGYYRTRLSNTTLPRITA
jgi:hypothetical protein